MSFPALSHVDLSRLISTNLAKVMVRKPRTTFAYERGLKMSKSFVSCIIIVTTVAIAMAWSAAYIIESISANMLANNVIGL